MQPHWNASVNKSISSDRQFRAELAKKSEEMSEYTGHEHRYVPVDPSDTAKLGITGDGLDATNRERVSQGLPPVKIPGII
jgi:hypothetical protein